MSEAIVWWRHVALAGCVAGLLASPHLSAPAGWLPCLAAATLAIVLVGRRLLAGERAPATSVAGWLTCLLMLGALAGIGTGNARLAAIDGGALTGPAGSAVEASGFIAAVPRRSFGEVRVPLDTESGRVLVVAPEPVAELAVGGRVEVTGTLTEPADPFTLADAQRSGAELVLEATSLRSLEGGRGGIAGALDRVRARAEQALATGMDEDQAALARGFVLGQDDLIDARTREQFERAGLSHLLAVSGQNVMLLAILAGVVFAVFGAGLRLRLLLTVALIAAYVPVAGAGPSIARAGVMGAAGILATLAGRPADRAYLALLAAALTLVLNPRFGADVGWQLSFAAVLGIMLWARPLRDLLLARPGRRLPGRLAAPIAEGAALTLAATVATAPLMAHHFEQVSLAAIPANLLVIWAVAPVMWIGMLLGLAGQLPIAPPEPLGVVEGWLIDYVSGVAEVFAAPGWAEVQLPLPGALNVLALYAAIALVAAAALRLLRRRSGLAAPRGIVLAGSAVLLVALLVVARPERGPAGSPGSGTLRITALDVGQGDSILLEPPRGDPILVDGGPPGAAAADALRERGIARLRAVFLTHDQLDHAAGLVDVLAATRVERLIRARPASELDAAARLSGTRVMATGEGGGFDFGRLTIDVLWPPRDDSASAAPTTDLNATSLVLAARFAGYDALLTGDAESEVTHLDPGALDVLKVAHHGSDDAGLESLLERSVPRVALIGVGADNGYGHPTPDTTATLAEHGVCTLRTDLDGDVSVELGPTGVVASTAEGPPPEDRPGCASGAHD